MNFQDHSKSGTSQTKYKTTSAATVVRSDLQSTTPNVNSQTNCLFCSFQHPFKVCRKFRKLLHKEKITFLMKHRLCFGCLGGDHMRSECSQKVTCEVCGESHPTPLHRLPSNNSTPNQSSEET